jgi:hypothetical protein
MTNDFKIAKRLPLPSKDKIKKHWAEKYQDDFFLESNECWGCGLPKNRERAHLHADSCGGGNHPDNFILLCKFCHDHIQEKWTSTKQEGEIIREKILFGLPFASISWKVQFMLYEHDLIPDKILKAANELVKKKCSEKCIEFTEVPKYSDYLNSKYEDK